MRLQGKVALVTGGAAGIGKATAQRFVEEGARVALCDINLEQGQAVAEELGNGTTFHQVNVAHKQQVRTWVEAVTDHYQQIDILVNNAGIVRDNQLVKFRQGSLIGEMPEEDFDQVIAVNLKGVFNGAQAVAPHMIAQRTGVILNASSVVGLDGNFGQTNYVASKAGVIGMTQVWARELGRYGVRVNAVAPGFIGTDIISHMPEKIFESMKQRTLLRRVGDPHDIANAYLFLASDEASFITGTLLRVDGGLVVGT